VVADGWFSFLVSAGKGTWFTTVSVLRYPAVIIGGAVIAAALTFRRDLPRACALLIGPTLALITCELVAKPLVGRTLGGVYSFPSGSTVGAAALATAVALATPARWRAAVIAVGALYALWMALAVITLQWHLPTDAFAGLAYGAGVVLLADGTAWKVAVRLRHRSDVIPTHHSPMSPTA
jgi:undecaprenyl-diphosphatase